MGQSEQLEFKPRVVQKPANAAPRDLAAERALLGSLIIDPARTFRACVDIVSAADFFQPLHARVWRLALELWTKGVDIDPVTVCAASRDIEHVNLAPEEFAGWAAEVPTAAHAAHYARIVRDMARRRAIQNAAETMLRIAVEAQSVDEALSVAQREIIALSADRARSSMVSAGDAAQAALQEIMEHHNAGRKITGLCTGFGELDEMLCGLQPTDLIIVAGRPSMGKTAFATAIARNASCRTPFFSAEMATTPLAKRLLAAGSGVDAQRMRSCGVREEEWIGLRRAALDLGQCGILFDDTNNVTVDDIRTRARLAHTERPIGLVVVDYLQLVKGFGDTREQEVSYVSRGLKGLAKELRIPVIAVAQLNRSLEARPDKRPIMSDLRDSGAMEQDADVVLFVYRDEYYNQNTREPGIAEVIVSKQRNGPTGKVKLLFDRERTAFADPRARQQKMF